MVPSEESEIPVSIEKDIFEKEPVNRGEGRRYKIPDKNLTPAQLDARKDYDQQMAALLDRWVESGYTANLFIRKTFPSLKEGTPTPIKKEFIKEFKLATKEKEDGRTAKQEGSLMVPPEMEQDMPVDTYPNIPPEEMAEAEASQLPDAEMEDKFIDFVMDESLEEEEQSYLMNALEADPKLSQIFDKVMTTASEFTGSGEVEGPGTGVSDSIPARLSDGEFVFTKKATDQMGADNLQMMMDDAEREFDNGEMREPAQEGGLLLYKQKDEDPLAYEKIAQDEIKKSMLRSNSAPSLNPGSI